MIQKIFICVILLSTLSACSNLLPFENPRHYATRIAKAGGFKQSTIPTQNFELCVFTQEKILSTDKRLTIYIEGDGHAWINRYTISPDPTPLNPLALKLALRDPSPKVAYLARPCQFGTQTQHCNPMLWTDKRFGEEVIAAMNTAIQLLKTQYKAHILRLVGFSGGAAVAMLVAARRHDIESIITVAGDLDHKALSFYHQTTPLKGSLNPINVLPKIAHIRQHHLVGNCDPIIPTSLSENFVNKVHSCNKNHGRNLANHTVLSGFTHHEGWEEKWKDILVHCDQEASDSRKIDISVAQNNPCL